MPFCLNNCRFYVHLKSNRTLLLCPTRHVRSRSLTVQSSGIISSDPAMASNSVRVAAVQMTSINDLAANFATCSRLVKVYSLFNFSSAHSFCYLLLVCSGFHFWLRIPSTYLIKISVISVDNRFYLLTSEYLIDNYNTMIIVVLFVLIM